MTPSETYAAELCARSFLRLWTHPCPVRLDGKELCDCLIVCEDDVVIVSVKEVEFKDTGDDVGRLRWNREAVKKSADQVFGAERRLRRGEPIKNNRGTVIELPPPGRMRVHRVLVAFGANRKVFVDWGQMGKGFVFVLDERSLGIALSHLDTIADFTGFLSAAEALVEGGVEVLLGGGGLEDLVGMYLACGYRFPVSINGPMKLELKEDIWTRFSSSPGYDHLRKLHTESYLWDRFIEHVSNDVLGDGLLNTMSGGVTHDHAALAVMAREPRLARTALARALREFFLSDDCEATARIASSTPGVAYVFLAASTSEQPARSRELFERCCLVRGRMPGVRTVVGIATDRARDKVLRYSIDLSIVDTPDWPPELEALARRAEEDGHFEGVDWRSMVTSPS